MKTFMIYKLISLFALIYVVMANAESELEQPTKLLGGKTYIKYNKSVTKTQTTRK